ncbi:putative polynucleotide adenylyltransferase [Helianthus anomalus]
MVGSEVLPSPKQHGVTKPLSLAGPSNADLLRTKKLNKVGFCYLIICVFINIKDIRVSLFD